MRKSLSLTSIKGTTRFCGEAYGEAFSEEIAEFLDIEVKPDPKRISYAKRCLKYVERDASHAMAFMKGMAGASGLDLERITLLALHEEIAHQEHCTALLARKEATKEGKTIMGQNWDWPPERFSWAGLLKLSMKGSPKMITYHYPGLWASLGLNEAGLALMWTGAGYWPMLKPRAGVPTYALISELLRLKRVDKAVDYLKKTRHAGSFQLFLADASGEGAIIEAVPGRLAIERGADIYTRANHYECEQIVRASRQRLPQKKKSNTGARERYVSRLMREKHGKISKRAAQKILLDENEIYGQDEKVMTIDSFVAVCEERSLYVRRGGSDTNRWKTYSL